MLSEHSLLHTSTVGHFKPAILQIFFYLFYIIESLPEALSDTQKQVTVQLEALPHQVIRQVRTFNENVKYLLEAEVLGEEKETLPDGLKRLLDDVAGAETIGDRIKQEILRDHNTKRVSTCFFVVQTSGSYLHLLRLYYLLVSKVCFSFSCFVRCLTGTCRYASSDDRPCGGCLKVFAKARSHQCSFITTAR